MTDASDPHRELFQAADAALFALDHDGPIAETLLRFELAALREAGHAPSLDQCVVCGQPVGLDKRVPLDMAAGGVLCNECRPSRRGVVSVSGGVIAALRQMTEQNGTEYRLNSTILGELRAVMSNYFAHLVGHRLRMSAYLGAASP